MITLIASTFIDFNTFIPLINELTGKRCTDHIDQSFFKPDMQQAYMSILDKLKNEEMGNWNNPIWTIKDPAIQRLIDFTFLLDHLIDPKIGADICLYTELKILSIE